MSTNLSGTIGWAAVACAPLERNSRACKNTTSPTYRWAGGAIRGKTLGASKFIHSFICHSVERRFPFRKRAWSFPTCQWAGVRHQGEDAGREHIEARQYASRRWQHRRPRARRAGVHHDVLSLAAAPRHPRLRVCGARVSCGARGSSCSMAAISRVFSARMGCWHGAEHALCGCHCVKHTANVSMRCSACEVCHGTVESLARVQQQNGRFAPGTLA